MSNYQPAPEGKDPVLWEIAHKRASFKKHLITYLIMSAFFWAVWMFSSNDDMKELDIDSPGHFPWPIWPMLGWGIGLAFHYASAYIFPRANSIESEYEKLQQQQRK